jgi:hypothetical protein
LYSSKSDKLGEAKMRVLAWMIFGTAVIFSVAPAWAQGRYDPAYPVCMEVYGADGSRIECFYTSMAQRNSKGHGRGLLQQPHLRGTTARTGSRRRDSTRACSEIKKTEALIIAKIGPKSMASKRTEIAIETNSHRPGRRCSEPAPSHAALD